MLDPSRSGRGRTEACIMYASVPVDHLCDGLGAASQGLCRMEAFALAAPLDAAVHYLDPFAGAPVSRPLKYSVNGQ
jgi:hypothetical protein